MPSTHDRTASDRAGRGPDAHRGAGRSARRRLGARRAAARPPADRRLRDALPQLASRAGRAAPAPASCTATSSRRTCWSRATAASCCSTSAWSPTVARGPRRADGDCGRRHAGVHGARAGASATADAPRATGTASASMLYEALTGRLPFDGPPARIVMRASSRREPPPPRLALPGMPEDLERAVHGAPARDPARAADGAEVLRRLGGARGAPAAASIAARAAPRTSRWSGRERARSAALRDAFARTPRAATAVTVLVHGASGMGKSALVRAFLDEIAPRARAVVLAGRCYERESVPYKALDSLVDALQPVTCAALPRDEVAALLPRDVAALARCSRCCAGSTRWIASVAPRSRRRIRTSCGGARSARCASCSRGSPTRRPLVLFIDDLQWGDADSAPLLELIRPPEPPPLLLLGLLSQRGGGAPPTRCAALVDGLRARGPRGDMREIEVGALAADEARELARDLLRRGGAREPARRRDRARVARRSVPHRSAGALRRTPSRRPGGAIPSLGDVIARALDQLGDDARRVLELDRGGGAAARAAARRCRGRAREPDGQVHGPSCGAGALVRTSRRAASWRRMESYHDRIRERWSRGCCRTSTRRHLALGHALEEPSAATQRRWPCTCSAPATWSVRPSTRSRRRTTPRPRWRSIAPRCCIAGRSTSTPAAGGDPLALSLSSRPRWCNAAWCRGRADYLDAAAARTSPRRPSPGAVAVAGRRARAAPARRRAAAALRSRRRRARALETVLAAVGLRMPSSPGRAVPSLLWRRLRLACAGSSRPGRARWIPRDW